MELFDFTRDFCRITPDRAALSLNESGDGSCIFLDGGMDCRIDPVKPEQCRNFPEKWNFPGWEKLCAGATAEAERKIAERRTELEEKRRRKGGILVISGPSGVGKSTLVGRLREAFPGLEFSISCTTRPPRGTEKNGVEYYFISESEFERRLAAGEFLEHAGVFDRHYGTLKSEVFDRIRGGADCVLDIDVQGAMQIREKCASDPELAALTSFIFIGPPSFAELEKRLRSRRTDDEEQIRLRLATAEKELASYRKYDYLVINDDLETAARELTGLVSALSLRVGRYGEGVFYE